MSWLETRPLRAALACGLILSLAALSACTVRPLYSNGGATASTGGSALAADLSTVAIKPVETRSAQEVRNQLIFLFGKGAGQPASPSYTMTLQVSQIDDRYVSVAVADDNDPSLGTLTMTANYAVTETATGQTVSQGTRRISASYDVLKQEFANVRASRDAENRVARELAEALHLAVAKDFARRQ